MPSYADHCAAVCASAASPSSLSSSPRATLIECGTLYPHCLCALACCDADAPSETPLYVSGERQRLAITERYPLYDVRAVERLASDTDIATRRAVTVLDLECGATRLDHATEMAVLRGAQRAQAVTFIERSFSHQLSARHPTCLTRHRVVYDAVATPPPPPHSTRHPATPTSLRRLQAPRPAAAVR